MTRWPGLLGAVLAVGYLGFGWRERPPAAGDIAAEVGEVGRGEIVVRSVYRGHLESRHTATVASRFEGEATLVELAAEGTAVEPGDLLARFDTTREERELVQYRTAVTLREAELAELLAAQQPLELLERVQHLEETRRALAAEERYLADSVELARDQLVSEAEVAQQRGKVEGLRDRLAALEAGLALTRAHSHPMEVRRAEATLLAAREELARGERQLANATIVAPEAGFVVYQPIHLGGEYRAVRVGDAVHANQPFLWVVDLTELVVRIAVPEGERAVVKTGNPVLVQPTAYPTMRLQGVVEQVSAVAQTLPDQPAWQRFFRASVALEAGSHSDLQPGMTVIAQVVAYQAEGVVLVPRRAVRFEAAGPTAAVVAADGSRQPRELSLGPASECCFEVRAGVEPGERVVLW